jgi:hypothetical protein
MNREQVADLNCHSPVCPKKGPDGTLYRLATGLRFDRVGAMMKRLGTGCKVCDVKNRPIQRVNHP